jgi:hypothetical protein
LLHFPKTSQKKVGGTTNASFLDKLMVLFSDINEDCEIGLCSYDLMLPDTATIHGRLYLGAWDAGLDNVADETVSLVQFATEVRIGNVG